MSRTCLHCGRPLMPEDLDRHETHELEAERRARGLRGARFLFYNCIPCGRASILVDVRRLEGESESVFHARRQAWEQVAREVHAEDVHVVVLER